MHSRPYDGLTSFALHRALLADRVRNGQYRAAIHRIVEPEDTVVDLGAGMGLLGLFACQAGARRVIAIERGPFRDIGMRLFAQNGYADRIIWISEDSLEVALTCKADVVVTETLGNFGVDEGILTYLPDARQRFLRPDGRLLPSRLRLYVAPTNLRPDAIRAAFAVECPQALRRELLGSRWISSVTVESLAGNPVLLWEADLATTPVGVDFDARTTMVTNRDDIVTGVAGWFVAELADGVELSTGPDAEATHWRQVFFPSPEPHVLKAGTVIGLSVRATWLGAGTAWDWSIGIDGAPSDIPRLRQPVAPFPRLRLTAHGRKVHEMMNSSVTD